MNTPTIWQERLARLRVHGWTMSKVAELVGCNRSTIHAIDKGRTREPTYTVGRGIERLVEGLPKGGSRREAGAA